MADRTIRLRSIGGIPVLSFVGRSGAGKTTLLEGVISELDRRGLRVAVVKHHAHDIELDVPRKDSWRHARAGAHATIVSGPSQFALVRRVDCERTLEELVGLVGDVDVVLTEGFRGAGAPVLEVLRGARSDEPSCSAQELAAIATDVPPNALPVSITQAVNAGDLALFGLDEADAIAGAIADAIERANAT